MSPSSISSTDLVTVADLKVQLETHPPVLLDVREPVEYAAGHIPGARPLPLSELDTSQLTFPLDQPLVLYCQSGKRSAQAAQRLQRAGFTRIHQLQGGFTAWQVAGYPLERPAGAPISLFRQVQIVAGSLVLVGTVLGSLVSPWFLVLSGFVGAGLVFAGVTNTCALGMVLARLPYNRRFGQSWQSG